MLLGESFSSAALGFGVMFGAVGVGVGLVTGIAVARLGLGARLEQVSAGRVAAWGFVFGFAPFGLLGALAAASSGTVGAAGLLLGIGAVAGGALGGLGVAVSKKPPSSEIADVDERPSLPAT